MGMVSAVGLSAPEVAAAVRSGVMRFSDSSFTDKHVQPVVLAEVPEEGLPPLDASLQESNLTAREVRLIRLADVALRECLANLPDAAPPPPLVVALPEVDTQRALDEGRLKKALSIQVGGFDPKGVEAGFRGRSGGLRAIARAVDWLAAGAAFVVAGGVAQIRHQP
jgi:hypothetical protein